MKLDRFQDLSLLWSIVTPFGQVILVDTIVVRLDPSIPALSIFGVWPQSDQNISLENTIKRCHKNRLYVCL